jgi:hypothetical protein
MQNGIIDKKDIAKETLSFILGLTTTAMGFFLALFFNAKVQSEKESESYINIKKSIIAELNQNQITIDSSFFLYIDGIIFNELNTSSSKQQLTNDTFIKFTNSDLLIALQDYIRKCELCNKQNMQLKEIRMENKVNKWEIALQMSMEKTLAATEQSIINLRTQLGSL